MYCGERLRFVGGAHLTPLIGTVEVLGYRMSSPIQKVVGLDSKSIVGELNSSPNLRDPFNLSRLPLKPYTCYSSLTHSILSIESVAADPGVEAKEMEKENKKLIPVSIYHRAEDLNRAQQLDFSASHQALRATLALEIPQLFMKAQMYGLVAPFDSLVLVSDATGNQFQLFQGSEAFQAPNRRLQAIFTPPQAFKPLLPGFYPIMDPIPNVTGFRVPAEWAASCHNFIQMAVDYAQGDSSEYPVAVVCGYKNSGKSSLSRLLVNKLLGKFSTVAYINCDVGQTEFTPPGLLTLHFLTEPILGPPFTQLRGPVLASYLGDTHPGNCAGHLFDTVAHFLDFALSAGNFPVVINTNGWFRGHIFQMGQADGLNATRLPIVSYGYLPSHHQFNPEHHRTLALASYLLSSPSGWSLDIPLSRRASQAIPWSQVEFWVLLGDLHLSQALYAFDGAVVGLYTSPTHPVPAPAQGIFPPRLVQPSIARFPPPAHYNCVGLAYVRLIDPTTGTLHLITPLDRSTLGKVVAIAKGPLGLPRELLH
ncbi:Polynucleotide 5'-hydroxyl-kinase grc3 [Massospora cicadina]|nr:Polynucleotide 5'-hydroxyl-kinase grc3 [Massospora cicadina]